MRLRWPWSQRTSSRCRTTRLPCPRTRRRWHRPCRPPPARARHSTGSGGTATGNSGSPTQGSRAITDAANSVATETAVITPTGGGTGGGTGGSGSGTSTSSDTPEQIASDQADIDTAKAQRTEAEQSLAAATLTSPINGTIVSVGITAGDTVSANSSTAVIVIIGTQSFEVTAHPLERAGPFGQGR